MEVNKNTLAGAMTALGKLICRTSPLTLCKVVKIETKEGKLKLATCGLEEEVTFELETGGENVFCCLVGFDEFRDAVRGGRNKMVGLSYEAGVLQVGDRCLVTVKDVEWPDFSPETELKSCKLPEGVVGLFARAAQVVDRNEPRTVLRGIHLSSNGIAVTNGKELLNYDTPLELEKDITIPLPLALIQSKATEAGTLTYWTKGTDVRFKIQVGAWRWTGKALAGDYPNWKRVIPEPATLTRSISFLQERGEQLAIFLKNVPDDVPHNVVELSDGTGNTLDIRASDMQTSIAADLIGDWKESLFIDRAILLRLLQEGHTKIELGTDFSPILASGGRGRFIAMPLRRVQNEKTQTQPKQEESKMENTEKVVSAPMQTVTPKQEPENALNPLDDLSEAVEAFKLKLKASFDEAATLARKVKEAQIAQKQKERDFIQARRAIERIRMVSGF